MNIRRRRQEHDAIVVGSGMSGGWAAKELTELGATVLVLEAGPAVARPGDPSLIGQLHPPQRGPEWTGNCNGTAEIGAQDRL